MIKKVSIITIIAVVVVSLAIVAIARYQRTVYPTVARGLSVATDNGRSNLAEDTLIAADKATAAPEFAKGVWINSDPLTMEKLRGQVVLVEFWPDMEGVRRRSLAHDFRSRQARPHSMAARRRREI